MSNVEMTCKDCGTRFIFTAKEQRFFALKGFEGTPVRCAECRQKKRKHYMEKDAKGKRYFETVCAACGSPARIPFVPKGDKPTFCSKCKSMHENENELTES